ncbi:MAG: PAS domain-containing protein [Bacteroidia bacterium]|nr:PAS domain-containing protein [Bacteroidia bacterium]
MKHKHTGKLSNSTLDNLLEGFQVIGFDWRYLYVNDSVLQQSKYKTKEELIGFTMMEKYPGIEKTEMFKVLQRCMKNRVMEELENEFTFPDNSKGWFELRIEPVPEGLFILSIDITKRKQAELERRKYASGLKEMLFMTSHKVRQPVAHILGISNLLDTSKLSQDELCKIVGYMKGSVESLDSFTKELTAYIHALKASAPVNEGK